MNNNKLAVSVPTPPTITTTTTASPIVRGWIIKTHQPGSMDLRILMFGHIECDRLPPSFSCSTVTEESR